MKHLKTYKIFESSSDEWMTHVDEVKEHFYDLEDLSDIRIDKLWLSKDLKEFTQRGKKPGYYPGFIVSVKPTFSALEFDKFIEYLSGISACNKRIPEYFNMCEVETTTTKNEYRFSFLDKNWESITWSDDVIYKEHFKDKFKCPAFRYGTAKMTKSGDYSFLLRFIMPVSRIKANVNMTLLKDYISQKFGDYEINIDENTQTRDRTILVNSITVTCLGKKKE